MLKSENLYSKEFLSENFKVVKSLPSRERKLKKVQICQNAPIPLIHHIAIILEPKKKEKLFFDQKIKNCDKLINSS